MQLYSKTRCTRGVRVFFSEQECDLEYDLVHVVAVVATVAVSVSVSVSVSLLNGKDYSDLIKLLNSELDQLSNWLSANKLSLNVKKSYYMVFHRAKLKIDKHAAIKMNHEWCVFSKN